MLVEGHERGIIDRKRRMVCTKAIADVTDRNAEAFIRKDTDVWGTKVTKRPANASVEKRYGELVVLAEPPGATEA